MAGRREEQALRRRAADLRLRATVHSGAAQDRLADQPELHLEGRAGVLGEVLEARSLEILDDARAPVAGFWLDELLGQGVAEARQPAVGLPEGQKRPAQRVAGFGEYLPAGRGRRVVFDIHRRALLVQLQRQ